MAYRLWDKEKSKLALAAELVALAMKAIGSKHQVILLCDSAMTLLPYSDEIFSMYQSASTQETRYEIGQQIQAESYILSKFRKTQKL